MNESSPLSKADHPIAPHETTGDGNQGPVLESTPEQTQPKAGTEDYTGAPVPRPGRLTALRIALWGGVGAGLGVMAWFAIFFKGNEKESEAILYWHATDWFAFFLAVVVMLFWKLRVEPRLEERLLGKKHSAHAHSSHDVRSTITAALWALGFVFFVEVVVELVHGPLRHHPSLFFGTVCPMVVLCGGITYFWVRWAHKVLWGAALTWFLGTFAWSFLVAFVLIFCVKVHALILVEGANSH